MLETATLQNDGMNTCDQHQAELLLQYKYQGKCQMTVPRLIRNIALKRNSTWVN